MGTYWPQEAVLAAGPWDVDPEMGHERDPYAGEEAAAGLDLGPWDTQGSCDVLQPCDSKKQQQQQKNQ